VIILTNPSTDSTLLGETALENYSDEQSDSHVFKRFARFFKNCKNSESKNKVSNSVELALSGGTSASRNLTKVCDCFGCTVDNLPVKEGKIRGKRA
jgi:hypothetical protein